MLVKILPDGVSRSWTLLKEVIRGSSMPLVKIGDEELNKVFENLLSGNLTCWYGYDEGKVHTVVITEVLESDTSGVKNLLIFTVSIIEKVHASEYLSMLETLRDYAKSIDCRNVYCYSSNEKLTKLFEKYGADASYKLVRYEL